MRINKYLALYAGLSRRSADKAVSDSRVAVNGRVLQASQEVSDTDKVYLDSKLVVPHVDIKTIMLNKPEGYVCSREGQGSKTVYDLLPPELHNLKPVGRLDKDSSGLLLLTNDGDLANRLSHPSFEKQKTYLVSLNKPLRPDDQKKIEQGVKLEDGISKLKVKKSSYDIYEVTMHEGRNRQIRRTFEALGYYVRGLHRTQFGDYKLDDVKSGLFLEIQAQ